MVFKFVFLNFRILRNMSRYILHFILKKSYNTNSSCQIIFLSIYTTERPK